MYRCCKTRLLLLSFVSFFVSLFFLTFSVVSSSPAWLFLLFYVFSNVCRQPTQNRRGTIRVNIHQRAGYVHKWRSMFSTVVFVATTFQSISGLLLLVKSSRGNTHDLYTVDVKKGQLVVGIFPFTVLQIGNGSITSTINGNLQYSQDLPQELPCILKFRGEYKYVHKIKVLLPTPAGNMIMSHLQRKEKLQIRGLMKSLLIFLSFQCCLWVLFSNLKLTDDDQKKSLLTGRINILTLQQFF